jgi:FkbM family methyltransferase
VVAFEPASDTADKLCAAARRNGLLVEVVRTALGEHRGPVRIYADSRYDPADAGVRSQYGDGVLVETVPARSFDDWAEATGLRRLDVVKIDVEGAEAAVLAGMAGSLRTLRPRAVLVEVKQRERTEADAGDLRALLSSSGYICTGTSLDHNELFRPV